MNTGRTTPDPAGELTALIATLHEAERRIDELTGGEVDTVAAPDGRPFLLRRAQDQMRQRELARQAAVLDALPASVALVDPLGVVISVNESWRRFAFANAMREPAQGVGRNYLAICDNAKGADVLEIRRIGAGIRSVLDGTENTFSKEYPCHSPTEERWFLLTVTPLADDRSHGVVIMHLDISVRRLAEQAMAETLARLNEAQRVGRIGDWDLEIATGQSTWSPELFAIVGRDPSLGPPPDSDGYAAILDPASRARHAEQTALTISSRTRQEYELVVQRPDGARVNVLCAAVPVIGAGGQITRIHGTMQDITGRKRAELALVEREAELQETQRLAGLGSWFIDFDAKTVCRSDETSRIFGLVPQTDARSLLELSRDLEQVLTPESFRKMEGALRKTRALGEPYETELEVIRPDQSRDWALSRGEAVRDEAGRICGMRGTALDITERKRAEIYLAELSERTGRRERMLSTLLSSISDFAYIYDRKGRFLFVNQPLLDLWGIPLEAAVGKDFFELGYPDDLAVQLQREVQEVFETKKNVTGETPYVSPAGVAGLYEYILSPVIGADGAVEFVAGCTRDITERKRVESAVRESEARFSAAFEHAPIAVALVSTDGRWLRVNRAVCALFGYAEAELLGGSIGDITHPDDLEASLAIVRNLLAGEDRCQVQKRYVHKRGDTIDALLSSSLIRDAEGLPSYFVCQIQDITERKRAEDELRASNEKFLQLAGNITDVFWIRSADMREVHYVSPAFEQIWGSSVASLYASPQSWFSYIIPEDRERVMASFAGLADDQKAVDVEYRIMRPDGGIRGIRSRGFQVRDDSGKLVRNIGIVSDITARLEADEALRTSEEEFRMLAEAMPQIVWITQADGYNIYFNQQWMDYTGLTAAESRGDGWNKPFHADDQQGAFDAWQVATATAGVYSIESRLRRADGVYRWWLVRGVPVRDAAGEIVKWFGTCTDIHDLKVAELEIRRSNDALTFLTDFLRASEEEQRQLAAQLGTERSRLVAAQRVAKVGSWETDLNTMNVLWSEETYRIFEIDPQVTVTHEIFLAMLHPEDRVAVDKAFLASLLDPVPQSIEHRLLLPDGSVKFVEERWQVEVAEGGAPLRAIGTSQDITERKHAEFALVESQGLLLGAQKMEAVGQLAAGVAHEFNNILQALMSMATIAGLRGVSPEIVKIAADMETQIRRGASVTRQLLLSSRTQEVTKTTLDLRDQVASAADLLRRLIPENIELVVELPEARATIEADAGQIQQVLLNLAINARDAMPDGGRLTLRVASNGSEASFDVEDDGAGFDEHTREHLFEPFFTTKEVGKGTGLGLAVVNGIIEQHDGRIEVRSQPGKGSLFRVILPQTVLETHEQEQPVSMPMARASGRILLVEDEDGVREGIALLLGIIGYEVIATASAEAAMKLPLTPVPDLMLSDVSLPGIGGPALAKSLRARWPSMSVTLMTGYASESTRGVSSEEGWDILQKPFEMMQLGAHLAATFAARATESVPGAGPT